MQEITSALKDITHGVGATVFDDNYNLKKVVGISIDGTQLQEIPSMSKEEEHEFEMELVKQFHTRIRQLFLELNRQ